MKLWWIVVALALIVLLLPGCKGFLDGAVVTLNTSAEAGELYVTQLEQDYESDLQTIVDRDMNTEDAMLAMDVVRRQYAPAFNAYRSFRSVWLLAASAVREAQAAEQDGGEIDADTITALLRSVLDAVAKMKQVHP